MDSESDHCSSRRWLDCLSLNRVLVVLSVCFILSYNLPHHKFTFIASTQVNDSTDVAAVVLHNASIQQPHKVISITPSPTKSSRAAFIPSDTYYRRKPSNKTPVKVCVFAAQEPQKSSLFIRNYLRQWGGELEFYVDEFTKQTLLNEYFAIGQVTKGDLQLRSFDDCPVGWPVLRLFATKDHGQQDVETLEADSYPGEVLVKVGDEHCTCFSGLLANCGSGGRFDFRAYFSRKYRNIKYLPLGPRFEWNLVQANETRKSSHRKYSYNFQGSVTSHSRARLIQTMENADHSLYPSISRGKLAYNERFHKFLVTGKNYSAPHLYRNILLDSVFTLCPVGANPESYRIWEAIDSGSIPVLCLDRYYKRSQCKDAYGKLQDAPFIFIQDWKEWPATMEKLLSDKHALDRIQDELVKWRATFWARVSRSVDCTIIKKHNANQHKTGGGYFYDEQRFCSEQRT